MSAIDQYLSLLAEQHTALDSHSPQVLNSMRDAAARLLHRAGRLPIRSDEGYEKTSIEEMFAPDFGVNINRVNIPVDAAATFRCDVPNISTLMGIVANDRFVATSTLLRNLPEGVTFCSFRDAPAPLLEKYLGKIASREDATLAFNSLLLQDGVLIHIAKGIRPEKPLQLVDIFSSPAPLFAPRRVLLIAEEDSAVTLLKCDHTQTPGVPFASSEVVEILCERGASVEWYDLEESTPKTARYCRFHARQHEGSSLNIISATLTNGTTRNEFIVEVAGDHCCTQISGMAIGSGKQHIDNSTLLLHHSDHSHSDQLFKYVLDDSASGAFEGEIEVGHDARFNEAYQSNRNLLASENARMHTSPRLLIYNDDVKCSHGASTGQLDANALFYMRQRGIPLEEARRMLMQAFMVDVVSRIGMEHLRDRLRHLLEVRFSGKCDDATCAGCRSDIDSQNCR